MRKGKRKRPYRLFSGKVLTGIVTAAAYDRSFRRFRFLPCVEQLEDGLPDQFGRGALRKETGEFVRLEFHCLRLVGLFLGHDGEYLVHIQLPLLTELFHANRLR